MIRGRSMCAHSTGPSMSDGHGNIGCMSTTSCEHCGATLGRDAKGRLKRFCDRACVARGTKRGPYAVPWQDRFWRYVQRGGVDECWEWQGSRDRSGYGRLKSDRSNAQIKAHRASYEIHHGPIPNGLLVCHHCDNPPCVNPAHLFLGTYVDNGQDMTAKGRHGSKWSGEANHNARLSDEDVRVIRERVAAGWLHRHVAADYGIAVGYVSLLATGRTRLQAGGPLTRRRAGRKATR